MTGLSPSLNNIINNNNNSYADDLMLMAKEETVLQGMIDKLIEIGRYYGMEMNVEKTKVMRISRQPSPVTIKIDQKQLENVKCFKYLGSMLTENGICTCEIESRIAMAKAAFSKKNLFTSKLDVNLRKKLVKCYVWSIALYGAETWTLQTRNTWKVLKCSAGEDKLDRSCEK